MAIGSRVLLCSIPAVLESSMADMLVPIVKMAEEVSNADIMLSNDKLLCSIPAVILDKLLRTITEKLAIAGVTVVKLSNDELLCSTAIVDLEGIGVCNDIKLNKDGPLCSICDEFSTAVLLVVATRAVIKLTIVVLLFTGTATDIALLSKAGATLLLTGKITVDIDDMKLLPENEVTACVDSTLLAGMEITLCIISEEIL